MSWLDSKAIKNMPAEDREWARKVSSKNYLSELRTATQHHQQHRVQFIISKFLPHNSPVHFEAVMDAVTFENTAALMALLDGAQFYPTFSYSEFKEKMQRLFCHAAGKSAEIYKIVHVLNERKEYMNKLSAYEFADKLEPENSTPETWTAIARTFSPKEGSWLTIITKSSVEQLKAVLADQPPSAEHLEKLLRAFIKRDMLDKLKTVFASCPDTPVNNLALLAYAIDEGRAEIAEFMLLHMAPDKESQLHTLNAVRKISAFDTTISALQKKVTDGTKAQYTLADHDTLSTTQSLPNMTLTTIFNFTLKQQSQIVEKDGKMAITTTGFHELNEDVVEDMRRKLLALGGKAEETVLSMHIKKFTPNA